MSAPIPPPHIDYLAVAPMLVVFGAGVLGVAAEALLPPQSRRRAQLALSVAGLAAALAAVVVVAATRHTGRTAEGALVIDGPALFLQGTVLVLSILSLVLIAGAAEDAPRTEAFPLALFVVGGLLLFPAADDLLTMFVALEVLSLPLYLLCGLARRRRQLSHEAALKYFLLGAFSSAIFLYGVAMVYGFAGSVSLVEVARAAAQRPGGLALLLIGTALIGVALLFKIGAVPFHAWIPDVYQGAPTPVTGFMAAATKVATIGPLLRLLTVAFAGVRVHWVPTLWGAAILSMVLGAVVAVVQQDVKRMLAYSAIANAGFLLTGVVAAGGAALPAVLFYVLAYGVTTVGAFAVVTAVRDGDGEAGRIAAWAGLARTSPLVAAAFALFLLALTGIPLTSGFTGKFAIFAAAVGGGATPLVVVGVLASVVTALVYLRLIVLMFFREPESGGAVVAAGAPTFAVIALGALITLGLGVFPQPVLDLARAAAPFAH